MKIKLLPVYSKLAEKGEIPLELHQRLPVGWRLSKHQVETYRALRDGNADVIFNTALTGDGKSLAGQLNCLIQGGISYPVLAMYPTNELINDQMLQLNQTIETWHADVFPRVMFGSELDQIILEEDYSRRGDALMRVLRNGDIILTNPDIFHYVMHQFYTYPNDAPDRYSAPLAQKFRQITFDEFHIFDASQIVSVLNALLFIHEISGEIREHAFLFLSATPKNLFLEYLERSGLRITQIEGEYSTQGDGEHWRKILNPVDLYFESESRAEKWLDVHTEDILLPFFLERGAHAKGAIIVNSVASAHRIFEKITPLLNPQGIKVALNTGLTSRTRRKLSYQADLLVGTSTIDVGVDFQINLLIFESRDSGSFLQRLGRLGRHDGYLCDGQFIDFNDFYAFALLPDWINQRLFSDKGDSNSMLSDGETVDRLMFNRAIEESYPTYSEFEQYARSWGELQTVKLLWGLTRQPIKVQYKESRERLQKRYEEMYKIRIPAAIGKYKELHKNAPVLLDEALSFRGNTDFPCCVIDPSEFLEEERFKCADLLQLAANYQLEYLDEITFYSAVHETSLNPEYFKRYEPLGFFILRGMHEYEKFIFLLDRDILYWGADKFGKAQVLKGFHLDADIPGINEVNRRLSRRSLPALLCSGLMPIEVKRRLNLPMLFPLYEIKSRDGVSGTVAFGRAALMLDSRLMYHPIQCGGGAIIT